MSPTQATGQDRSQEFEHSPPFWLQTRSLRWKEPPSPRARHLQTQQRPSPSRPGPGQHPGLRQHLAAAGKSPGPGVRGPGFGAGSLQPFHPTCTSASQLSAIRDPSSRLLLNPSITCYHLKPRQLNFLTYVTLASSEVTNDHEITDSMCDGSGAERPWA